MKNRIIIVLAAVFMCSLSCKKKDKTAEMQDDSTEVVFSEKSEENDNDNSERIEDCDDFLEQYEDWTKEYARFMEKYKDNPGQAYGDQEFIKMLSSATTWTTEWATIVSSCAVNPFYEKRMKEITQNMDDKMKELGFAN